MYLLSRLMLIAAVALAVPCTVLAAILAIQEFFPENQELVWAILIVGMIAVAVRKKGRRIFTSGGTAVWASTAELERADMLDAGTGLILGRVPSEGTPFGQAVKALVNTNLDAKESCRQCFASLNGRKRKQGRLVRLPRSAVHAMIVAPVGAGKSTGLVIPFLLTGQESVVCVDFKGELASASAEHRRRMGQKTVILDPYKVLKQKRRRDCFNPLDFIQPDDPLALDDCRSLAEAFVVRTGDEKDPHWNDSAEAVIASAIAVVVMYGQKDKGKRSLQDVRDILAHPQKFEIAKKLMIQHGGMLARWGGQLEHLKGDELASVMSTCNRHLHFLDTLAVAENTSSSSFDPAGLRKGKMTAYLVLPPEHMRTQSPLLRMWISSLFRACLRGGLRETDKVHFVLDEAAALGHMDALDDAVDKYRGYGVRLLFAYQSMGQLRKCWPKDEGQTLLANTSKIFFGTNDYQTAEFLSKSLGNETILVEGGSRNSGWSKSTSTSTGQSSGSSTTGHSGGSGSDWKQQSRELLKPDEVMQLDPRIAITLTPGVRPLWTHLLRYYEEKALFRYGGRLSRLAAACRTLLLSMALLGIAIALAAMITAEFNNRTEQQAKQPLSHAYQPPPVLPPVNAGGQDTAAP